MEARILETGFDEDFSLFASHPDAGTHLEPDVADLLDPDAGDLDEYAALASRLAAEAGDLPGDLMGAGSSLYSAARSGGAGGALGAVGQMALGRAARAKGAVGTIGRLGQAAFSGAQSGGAGGALGGLAQAGSSMLGGAIKSTGAAKKTEGIAMGIGAATGGALGSMLGPIGTALGSAVGGFLGKAINSFGHWFAGLFKKKKKPSFAEHLKKVDPRLFAAMKAFHPTTLKALGPDPLSLYPPAMAAKLRAQIRKFGGKAALAPAQVLKILHKGGLDSAIRKAKALGKSILPRNVAGLDDAPPGGFSAPRIATLPRGPIEVISLEARRVRDALASNPALRALNARQLGDRLLVSAHAAIEGQEALLRSAGLDGQMHGESLDVAMSRRGRPRVAGSSRRLSPRKVRVLRAAPRPAGYAFNALLPEGQRRLVALVPALRGIDTGRARMLMGGLSTRDASGLDADPHFYIIESGDTGQKIAKMFTGDQSRWPELVAANPSTKDPTYGFKANVGQKVRLPDSWVPQPQAEDDTPTVPTVPTVPTPSVPSAGQGYAYVVQSGDTGQTIAKRFTGDINRWPELVAANPTTASPEYGFKANVGQKVMLPPSWWASAANVPGAIPLGGAPAPSPAPAPAPAPPPPGGMGPGSPPPGLPQLPPLPTQPPNAPDVITGGPTYAKAQTDLAAWARATGASDPADFGAQLSDISGVRDDRSVGAIMSYQMWAPQHLKGQAPLRTDGELDQATFVSLETMLPQLLGKLGGQAPPSPAPPPAPPGFPSPPVPPGLPAPPLPGPAPAPSTSGGGGGLLPLVGVLAALVL